MSPSYIYILLNLITCPKLNSWNKFIVANGPINLHVMSMSLIIWNPKPNLVGIWEH